MTQVLVVEDDSNLRTIVRRILEKAGYQVIEACNGLEAPEKLSDNDIKLVITDILMPEREGIETIVGLRRQHPEMRIIAMSGGGKGGADHYLEMAREFGADMAMQKPFDKADLVAAVENLIGPAQS